MLMTSIAAIHSPIIRCAIYTRQSVEPSQVQEFGSLQAQRSICSSYIASQRPKGWTEIPKHYDDGGLSGGTLMRPALQDMLLDIESGLIDAVVIYKLDRITRTLLDFVRLIDLFEQFGVSFVAVTQNFDTGESTGRLILNVLLTFAQFEREIASDRLRDKFRAMRERGMFVGGNVPFGYALAGKKLVVEPSEAATVRWMFQRYLEVKSYAAITRELAAMDVCRRDRVSKRGNLVKGRRICVSSVWNMLGNQLYVGDAQGKGASFEGQHEAIVSRELWNKVQALRTKRTRQNVVLRYKADLLRDLMWDGYGRKMASYRDHRYSEVGRYYISNQSEWGRRHGVRRYRTRAEPLEELIVAAIKGVLCNREQVRGMLLRLGYHDGNITKLSAAGPSVARLLETTSARQSQCILKALIERIELSASWIKIVIRTPELPRMLAWNGIGLFKGDIAKWSCPHIIDVVDVPSNSISMKRELTMLLKPSKPPNAAKPNPRLVGLLRKARQAQAVLDERESYNVTELSARIHCHPKKFTSLVRLNYLAPDIVASILDGTQPAHIKCETLRNCNLPMDWSLQRKLLGFPDQPDFLKAAPGW
jgi:DNA invertase Pin-like site-specific DNA recombinase